MILATDAELVDAIARAAPDFVVKSWSLLGEGWMSRALRVNDEWVARFAKSEDGSRDQAKEAEVLPLVAERVSLRVPRFEIVGKQQNGLSFVMYRLLPGEPMVSGPSELDEPTQERVAVQIAGLITELQSLPTAPLRSKLLPEANLHADVTEQHRAWHGLRSELPRGLFDYVEQRFQQYLAEPTFHREERRFIHADLSPDHWLFDAARGELSGIIDFGDCELGDPDYEYLYLLEDAGEAFTRRVLTLQGAPDIDARLWKLRYLVTFDHAQGVLASARYGKPEWRQECLEALEAERLRAG